MKSMVLSLLLCILSVLSCQKVCTNPSCSLLPDAGLCKAAFKRYYFDQKEQKCKEFLWGGCDGVVPFETLEACQGQCPCVK